jgi:HK97 gp10 family phage protein
MTIKVGEEYAEKLSRLAANADEAAKKAIYQGAKVVADKIKANIESLPEDTYRYLMDGEKFSGLSNGQKKDLADSFGVTPIKLDSNGDLNAKLGFDGYGSFPTKAYPKGLPNQLLARAVESGSSVRRKNPFVRPAVNSTKAQAVEKMDEVIDNEIKKTMGG